jgi:hypothetical protein
MERETEGEVKIEINEPDKLSNQRCHEKQNPEVCDARDDAMKYPSPLPKNCLSASPQLAFPLMQVIRYT